MRITENRGVIENKELRRHDYDYRTDDRCMFAIFFPFHAIDGFYQDLLSESVMCADLSFICGDPKHPSLKVYLSKGTYNLDTPVIRKEMLFVPKTEIDKAISKICGENRLDAYLTTYDRRGAFACTTSIPHPYVTMDMVDDAPVLTMASL